MRTGVQSSMVYGRGGHKINDNNTERKKRRETCYSRPPDGKGAVMTSIAGPFGEDGLPGGLRRECTEKEDADARRKEFC